MKCTLRVTVMTAILGLILITVAGLGFSSARNARFTANDLSAQILEQTALRIDQQINDLMFTANHQSDLNRELLESGQFDIKAFPRLADYWVKVMQVHPRLTRISFGVEETGEWYYVKRNENGKLIVVELRRSPQTSKLELSDYWPGDYPRDRFFYSPNKEEDDPRMQPWYKAARSSGRQTWSETYALLSADGAAGAPGVTCATPVYRRDGSLVGVLSCSFDLLELCRYLGTLAVGEKGYAFAVEIRHDGSRQVIAHPDPQILLRASKANIQELVPMEELSDPCIGAFLSQVPANLKPVDIKDMATIHFTQDGTQFLGGYRCLSTDETPNWLICILMPEDDVLGDVWRSNRQTLWIGVGVFTLAVLASLFISRQVARPLEQLTQQVAAVGQLQFDAQPVPHSIIQEVDQLAAATEEMKAGLRSFRKYVPADLVRKLLEAGQEATLGGESRTVTIYFSDIANFTSTAEELPPAQLIEHLGDYLKAQSEQILGTEGTVDKYIGDSIMAFWGAPRLNPQHALSACTAALRNQQELAQLRDRWKREGKPLFYTRIGLHTGEVVVGNIGSEARLNYTVIGDSVNLASRLEGVNRYYGTEILISECTYLEVKDAALARPVDWVSVKGRTKPVLIYELLGLRSEPKGVDPPIEAPVEEFIELASQALAAYRRQDWDKGMKLFEQLLHLRPCDGPAQSMMARCRDYRGQWLGDNWDGVHRMDSK
jgi:adenylate cyclase